MGEGHKRSHVSMHGSDSKDFVDQTHPDHLPSPFDKAQLLPSSDGIQPLLLCGKW